jgi:hypothetical protein
MSLEDFFEQPYKIGLNIENALTIHLGFNYLILCVKNNQGKVLGLKYITFNDDIFSDKGFNELQNVFKKYSAISGGFNEVKISLDSPYFLPVPTSFSDDDKALLMLQSQFKIGNNFLICSRVHTPFDAVVYCALPDRLFNFLVGIYPQAKVFSVSLLLPDVFLSVAIDYPQVIIIHTDLQFLYISVFIDRKLHLLNSFEVNSDTDFLYFILNVIDKFNLSQTTCKVFISGLINESDSKLIELKRFVSEVQLLKTEVTNGVDDPLYFINSFLFSCE